MNLNLRYETKRKKKRAVFLTGYMPKSYREWTLNDNSCMVGSLFKIRLFIGPSSPFLFTLTALFYLATPPIEGQKFHPLRIQSFYPLNIFPVRRYGHSSIFTKMSSAEESLRDRYLQVWLNAIKNKSKVTFHMHGTVVTGKLCGTDSENNRFRVDHLETPMGTYEHTVIRGEDIDRMVIPH
ncbi:hypothetical protein BDB01DRAFT_832403 [Pilobolus umbonatus]|nr:hypothetical protein BDB01DRAFT_832403 [Pilobolus umbonatus]